MHRSTQLIYAVALIVAAALGWWWGASSGADAESHLVDQEASIATANLPGQSANYGPTPSASKPKQADGYAAAKETDFPEPMPGDWPIYYNAFTAEERDWMARNGFPTADQLKNFDSLDFDKLAERAVYDSTAQALVGMKLLKDDQWDDGISALERSAAMGSVFALSELGRSHYRYANQNNGAPWFQLAAMRGDHWATEDLNRNHFNLTLDDLRIAQSQAHQLWASLEGRSLSEFGRPLPPPTMRPNYDDHTQATLSAGGYPFDAYMQEILERHLMLQRLFETAGGQP